MVKTHPIPQEEPNILTPLIEVDHEGEPVWKIEKFVNHLPKSVKTRKIPFVPNTRLNGLGYQSSSKMNGAPNLRVARRNFVFAGLFRYRNS
jgi:hypothetical protein